MTASTRGYFCENARSISAATRCTAASTSAADAIRSEFSRNAQDCAASGIFSRLEVAREAFAGLGMAQAVVDGRLQVAELRAAVVAPARQAHREGLLVLQQCRDAIGELDLAAGARHHLR